MGRRTVIVATEQDEQSLLAFMRSVADVRILVANAKTADDLWSSNFAPYDRFHTKYYLWNTDFGWEPDIQPLGKNRVYVRDVSTAPIIEFDRTDVESLFRPNNTLLVAGGGSRLYWWKKQMAHRPSYDMAEFDRWYSRVIRWVRKNGKRHPDENAGSEQRAARDRSGT